ncbi:MAG: LuxR C-terminal-related transcriptional regulator [Rikenellaceae bacterium]
MSKRIQIIIAEPSAVIRCGVEALLQREEEFSCEVMHVSDASIFSARGGKLSADLIIVNPSFLGVFSPSQLKAELGGEEIKIVALQSSFIDQGLLHNYDETISIYESGEMIVKKIVALMRNTEEAENKKELSAREKEIIVCVAKGMINKQIAETLHLSTHTVIAHRRNIANKLQIHSPSGLTIYAIVNKLVDIADIQHDE